MEKPRSDDVLWNLPDYLFSLIEDDWSQSANHSQSQLHQLQVVVLRSLQHHISVWILWELCASVCSACRRKWRLTLLTSVSLWQDPDDVPHCRILSLTKLTGGVSQLYTGWRCCFMVYQLWFMTRTQEEEEEYYVMFITTPDDSPQAYVHVRSLVFLFCFLFFLLFISS